MSGFTTRPCAPEESQAWTEFLDRNFGYQAPQSYGVDFAPLFIKDALPRSRLVWSGNTIVGSATYHPARAITLGGRSLNLGIIGAVATHEGFRGQGISSTVLRELETAARAEGREGLVLWSDQIEFYAKQGFVPAGAQQIFQLDAVPVPAKLAPGVPVYGWDWDQVRTIYEGHPMRVARDDAYWQALQSVKSCTRVQWMDENGAVKAYLGFDRGKDLHGIVHEWGGDAAALHCLLWTVLQNRPNLFWLTHPSLPDPIRALLPAGTEPVMAGHLALMKPLAPSISSADLDQAWFWGLDSL